MECDKPDGPSEDYAMKKAARLVSTFLLLLTLCSSIAFAQETPSIALPSDVALPSEPETTSEVPAELEGVEAEQGEHTEQVELQEIEAAEAAAETEADEEALQEEEPQSLQEGRTTEKPASEDADEGNTPDQGVSLEPQADQVPTVRYRSHVQTIGWQDWSSDGEATGTFGRSLRLESFRIELRDAQGKQIKGISYRTHVQTIGWQDWVSDGALAGTERRSLRAEAIRIKLSDELAKSYDVWYQAHVQTFGWLGWAKNGEPCGSAGVSRRVEALCVTILPKGSPAPEQTDVEPFVDGTAYIALDGHVQRIGWKSGKGTVGTVGQSLRMEAIKAKLAGGNHAGDVCYSAHVQGIGWQDEASNGGLAGTSGQSKRVEAMTMRLSGEAADYYDVWYRMHVQRFGWLDWAKNGEKAGTAGYSLRCESIETKVLPKGMEPEGVGTAQYGCFVDKADEPVVTEGQSLADANAAQQRLVQSSYSTPSAPAGYCAQWVEDVYANAGFGRFYGDARDLYHEYCFSADLADLKVGMIVSVSTHPHTTAGSIWGHVGIYVGDGTVRDSVYGYVRTSTLEEWMNYYGASVPVKWGWIGNVSVA